MVIKAGVVLNTLVYRMDCAGILYTCAIMSLWLQKQDVPSHAHLGAVQA